MRLGGTWLAAAGSLVAIGNKATTTTIRTQREGGRIVAQILGTGAVDRQVNIGYVDPVRA
jgi:hypothetical protein